MTLTRQQLTQSSVRRFARVTIDDGVIHDDQASDLADHVRIQTITMPEVDDYEAIVYDSKGKYQPARVPLRRKKLLQLCLVDNDGVRLYADNEVAKVDMCGGLGRTIFAACVQFTGIDRDVISVADAKKNSSPTPDSETPTASA